MTDGLKGKMQIRKDCISAIPTPKFMISVVTFLAFFRQALSDVTIGLISKLASMAWRAHNMQQLWKLVGR